MPAIRVRHLAKSYRQIEAVRDVSFEVERGEIFALLGPNGAGKTTTVEILEGFRTRSSGEVETLGVDPARKDTQLLAAHPYRCRAARARNRALLHRAPGPEP